jgi:hypothetical protein
VTAIHFAYFKTAPGGVDVPEKGRLEFQLYRREIVGDRYRVEASFGVNLVDGVADVELSPTAPDQAWRVKELAPIAGRTSRGKWVTVPNVTTMNGVDLVEVDAATLDPTPGNLAGWDAVIAQVEAAVAAVEADRVNTLGYRTDAQAARDAAVDARDDAQGFRADADSSAAAAAISAATAGTYAGNAGTSATAAAGSASAAATSAAAAQAVPTSNDGIVAGLIGNTGSATRTALSATTAPLIASLELVPATQYGDSWGNNAGGSSADLTTAFAFRVCSRLRTQTLTDRSVSATRSDQIQQRIASTWTAPGRGVVFLADNLLNDAMQNRNTVTYRETSRSSLLYLSALNISGPTAANVQYGPGWTAGVSSVANSYADIAFTGDAVTIVALAGTTGGVYRIRDSSGTVRATVTTSGWADTFGLATPLTGFGAGNHSVRVEVVSGTVTLVNTLVPSTTPPLIVWNIPGDLAGAVGTAQNSKFPPFRTVAAEIAALFPNVVLVPAGAGWNPDLYLSTDQTHLNDAGNAYVAAQLIAALRGTPFAHGLNRMIVPSAYTLPAPHFTSPSATVPATVTGVTATAGYQVGVTWNTTTDGGATLDGYKVQASSDGTTWADVATVGPGVTAANIDSGLTQGTSYQFRVVAFNSVGTSAPSATATATAGPTLVIYSQDTLTGSGAMGTAQTGGQAWTTFAGVAYQRNADGASVATSVTDRNFCLVNDGQSDGVFEVEIGATGGVPGVQFDMSADFATGYLFWNSGPGTWTLSKQTALGTRTTIASAAGTMAANDKLTVVKSGSSIICKVNGVTILTATDATYSGTRHGLYSYSSTTARFKNWRHSS